MGFCLHRSTRDRENVSEIFSIFDHGPVQTLTCIHTYRSTARKVGKLFYDMGFLSCDEVVTCSATDLIGQYQGHTGPKVINLFETALGKVLFIDEAYRLAEGRGLGSSTFFVEAVGELVDAMTKPRYAGKMVVILAGYSEEMEFLLRSNPGLRSRFPAQVSFPHMIPHNCVQHLTQELSKLNITVTGGHCTPTDVEKWETIHRIFRKLSLTKGWANGRDVETLAKSIIAQVYIKAGMASQADAQEEETKLRFSTDELIKSLQDMLRARKGISMDAKG